MLKVSVIIPFYNGKKYLGECLESLAAQSIEECEFICVDDGFGDDSYKLVEAYAKKDMRFKLIRQENKGLAEARNVGMRHAKGTYLAFLDGDDCLQGKEALKELYNIAEKEKVDFVTFDADCFYESKELKDRDNRDSYYIRKREYGLYSKGRELFCELIEKDDFCDGAWVLFFKRDWMETNGLWFMPRLNPEDCIWSFQCYMHAGRVKHVQKRYYRYRIRSNSLTTEKVTFDVIYGRIYTVRDILKFALTNSLSEREERAICRFMDIILWHIRDKYLRLEAEEACRIRELSPLDSLLACHMNEPVLDVTRFNFQIYLKGFKTTLYKAPEILIYGAGRMGKLVYTYMKKEGLTHLFSGFVVSEPLSGETREESAAPVSIYDKSLSQNALVVVAVLSEPCRQKMARTAKEAGFTNILSADTYLLQILEEHYA